MGIHVNAQTIVSTNPANKNVVLEEFTGIYCTYCPDGHKIAQQIKDANPSRVVLVNIHTGGYAAPSGSDPDFRTNYGSAIAGQANLAGYPAGTVNRHQFSMTQNGGTAMSRGDWGTAANQEFAVSSPVNVAATATWDVGANQISIYVEAYYTANSSASANSLNVAILESNVPGPQTGGTTYNPTNFDSEGNYLHQHMLRDFVTGQWGVSVSPTTTGSFYSNTFTYPIPANYNGIVPELSEITVAVYMAEGQQEVLTGVEVPLTATNIPTQNNSALIDVEDLGSYCGTSASPTITIRNMGSSTLTSLDINYDINGGGSGLYQWTGSLNFYEKEDVTLPLIAYTPMGTNTINVSTSNPNGVVDNDLSNDLGSSSFSDAPEATSTTVFFELKTDQYGSETSWDVKDAGGNVLYSSSTTYGNSTVYNETWSFPNNGCYKFTIYDTYGDGILSPGYYRLTSNSVIIVSGGVFGTIEEKPFEETGGAGSSMTTSSNGTNPTSCGTNDGTATVTITGGTAPFTYNWSNGGTTATITGLAAGTYTATVIDNNSFTSSASVTLTAPSSPIISVSGTDPSGCGVNDGTATASSSSGTAPYTYNWSNGGNTAIVTGLAAGSYDVTVTDANACTDNTSVTINAPSSISASATSTDATCSASDGTVTAIVSGGTGPYNYLWDDPSAQTGSTAIGLVAGTYSVIVTDANSCTASSSATVISGGSSISFSFSATTDVLCFGGASGSATATATSGTAPYTYSWSNGNTSAAAAGLIAGTYMVTVEDANGCSGVNTVVISEPSPLSISSATVEPDCGASNGEISLTTAGGISPYIYQWDSNAGSQTTQTATGLAAGSYDVTITDANGCTVVNQLNLSNAGAGMLNSFITNVTCNGASDGEISTSIQGGTSPFDYAWSNGNNSMSLTSLVAGIYSVTVTDANGCIITEAIEVTEPAGLVLSMAYQNVSSDTVCDGQAIANVTGGTSPFAYLWDDNNVQTTQTAVGLCMGTYNVIVTDGNGCTSTSYVFVDSIVMGINKLVLIQPLKIYPNPFTTSTTIAFGNANAEPYLLLVYNMLGNTVRAIPGITESKVVIDRENLPSGVYFVYLQGKAKTFRGRMIVE